VLAGWRKNSKRIFPPPTLIGFFIAESHGILRLPAGRQELKPARLWRALRMTLKNSSHSE